MELELHSSTIFYFFKQKKKNMAWPAKTKLLNLITIFSNGAAATLMTYTVEYQCKPSNGNVSNTQNQAKTGKHQPKNGVLLQKTKKQNIENRNTKQMTGYNSN